MTKKCIFTHQDLDGAVCSLVLRWFYTTQQFEIYTIRNAHDFRDNFLSWSLHHDISAYDQIFILDLDLSGCQDLVDKPNFFIVDHHETHEKVIYKNAKAFVKKFSSGSKLLYKILCTKFSSIQLTHAQKLLIGIADDYDSYTLKSPFSKPMNTLFWNLNDNFNTFCKQFYQGFTGFSSQQLSIIKFYNAEFEKYKQSILEVYKGNLEFLNKQYTLCCFFADKFINDLSDSFFDTQEVDAIIMVNTKSNKVYVRKNRNSKTDLHVGKLCERWGGGGHEGAGGAPITEDFLNLTKTLIMKKL